MLKSLLIAFFVALPAAHGSPISTVEILKFDHVAMDPKSGQSALLNVVLPKDAISFTIFVIGPAAENRYQVDRVQGPQGQILVDPHPAGGIPAKVSELFGSDAGPLSSPNKSFSGYQGASLIVPNSPKVSIAPGVWKIGIIGKSYKDGPPSPVVDAPNVRVLVKRASLQLAKSAEVKLSVYFTGSYGLTTKTAPSDSGYQGALTRMRAIYKKVGISLKVISEADLKDVDAPGGSQYLHVGEGGDPKKFGEIFGMVKGIDSVNVVFVETINMPFAALSVRGLTLETPAPILLASSRNNAIFVSNEPFDANRTSSMGVTLGHELGHYLGLPHTFDDGNGFFEADPFDDTSEKFGESDNIMERGAERDSLNSLSPQQGQLLWRSPAVVLMSEPLRN